MRLSTLYINGFGQFHDLKIDGLSSGFTLFLGMNESGKSTLLGFLRALLFGFPDGRSNENLYPPLAGGQHGGNLILVNNNEELYVVERYPGPHGGKLDVLKPDQTHAGKAFLSRLLGISSRQLFKNIYAFGLSELQTFETLNTESVNDTLYSASAGIDSAGLAELRTELEKKENDLFKPGGSKPRINGILSRLMAISREKKGLLSSVEDYDRAKAQISDLIEKIQGMEEQRNRLSLQLKNIEKWISIWPEWIGLSLKKRDLESLEVIDDFPSQGLSRFESLKGRIEDLQNQFLERKEDIRALESRISSLKVDEALLKFAPAIRQLQDDLSHFRAVMPEIASRNQELALGKQKLEDSLKDIGPDWSEEKVLEFDLSIATREEVRHYKDLFEQATLQVYSKKETLEHFISRKSEAEELIRNLGEPAVTEPDRLAEMKRSCRELREFESEDRLLKKELENIDERLHDLREESRVLEGSLTQGVYGIPSWFIFLMSGLGLFILVLSIFYGEHLWTIQAGGVLLLSGLLLWIFKSRLKGKERERNQYVVNRIRYLAKSIDELQKKKSLVSGDLDRIKQRTQEAYATLSISETPSKAHLEHMEEDLAKSANELQRWINATEDASEAEKKCEKARQDLAHSESHANEIRDRFQDWLKTRGLKPSLSPDGALDTLSSISSMREQVGYLRGLRATIASLEETKNTFIEMANQALEGCHRKGVGEDHVQVAVHNLGLDFQETERAEQEKVLLTKGMNDTLEAGERIQKQAQKAREEMKALMLSGTADNEEQFRNRADTYEKREFLKSEINGHENRIMRFSNKLTSIYEVINELSNLSLEELEEDKINLEQEIKEIESTLDRHKMEQATLEERARQLASDDRISLLRTEEEGLKEELFSLAMEWSTARLAQALIRISWTKYQKEKQPDVIHESAAFFSRMTGGKYPSLVAPIGENRIDVMCQDNSQKGIDVLSRGTAEQLYLSLRFGFMREFSKTSEPLPIVMDDILVNFDPGRLKATAHAILELSQEHQILYFTCHPEMATLFRDIDPDTPVLEINDQGVKRLSL